MPRPKLGCGAKERRRRRRRRRKEKEEEEERSGIISYDTLEVTIAR
jgi:hypothetical protein